MSDKLSTNAGVTLSGKEGERSPEDLSGIAKSKLTRNKELKAGTTTDTVATKCDDSENQDEFYNECLLRMGIQI